MAFLCSVKNQRIKAILNQFSAYSCERATTLRSLHTHVRGLLPPGTLSELWGLFAQQRQLFIHSRTVTGQIMEMALSLTPLSVQGIDDSFDGFGTE